MIIRFIAAVILLTVTLSALSGCSIYRMDIQQGNYLTQAELAQIQPGMSRTAVQDILGTPLLTDDFRQNRWDYVFYIQKNGQVSQQRSVAVFFDEQGNVTNIRQDQ